MQTNTICEYFLKLHNKNVNKNKKVIKKNSQQTSNRD